jgi:hypothetical protein
VTGEEWLVTGEEWLVTGDYLQIHTFSKPEHQAPETNVGAPTFKVSKVI